MSNQELTDYNILFNGENESPINDILKWLIELGLTQNEAKVYMYLAKCGIKKAIEISKALNIPRTETYHLLTRLQNKGLVLVSMQHPIRYIARSFDETMSILIEKFEERIKGFEMRRTELLNKWEELPQFASEEEDVHDKMQILEGKASIYSKARELASNANERLYIVANEKEILHFYHYDIFDSIKDEIDVRVITDLSDKFMSIFSNQNIKISTNYESNTPCFIMFDYDEVLLFMNDESNLTALWTDCRSIVQSMDLLFKKLWY